MCVLSTAALHFVLPSSQLSKNKAKSSIRIWHFKNSKEDTENIRWKKVRGNYKQLSK